MKSQKNLDYYILSLNREQASLFKIQDADTKEIHDSVFPMSFHDEHQYSKSGRCTSFECALKNSGTTKFNKEKFITHLKEVNGTLKNYLDSDCALLLAGTSEDRASFKKVSNYNDIICGEISGSFNFNNLSKLKQLISNPGSDALFI